VYFSFQLLIFIFSMALHYFFRLRFRFEAISRHADFLFASARPLAAITPADVASCHADADIFLSPGSCATSMAARHAPAEHRRASRRRR